MYLTWEKLISAKVEKANREAFWSYIANALGSIPHRLILSEQCRYCVDSIAVSILEVYCKYLSSKSFPSSSPSN